MESKVKAFLEQIRPAIQSHGGDVEFVALEGTLVKVRLIGACGACPHALMTLRYGIEERIREEISPELSVERVS